MKLLAATVMSLALLDPVCAQTNASDRAQASAAKPPEITPTLSQTVSISRRGTRASTTGSAENFTGAVRVDPLFQPSEPARASAAYVTFAPGARSAWHSHPYGQTLVVTAGVGRVQRWGGPIEEIRPGDVVAIPPGVKHWHGAAPDSAMTHLAVQERQEGKSASWFEQVSDEQYLASTAAVGAPAKAAPGPSRAQQLMGDIAPKLADLTDRVLFGEVWARPGLSPRDRSLVTVSALIAMNRPEQLRSHMALARQNGLTQEELVEALTHLAFYAGWPNAITAVGVAREVFAKP